MRLAPPDHRAYTYKVTIAPATGAVPLQTFKDHIKRTNSSEDSLLQVYLDAAIDYAEGFIRRDLITRTYETFRDFFPLPGQNEGYYAFGSIPNRSSISTSFNSNVGFEIRKSPLQTVTSITYFKNGTLSETVSSTKYYNTVEDDYSEILTLDGFDWPDDADRRLQAIKIIFKTGFGDADTDIPRDITEAILAHATAMWKNKGDCDGAGCKLSLPAISKSIYLQNRLELM